MTELDPKQSRRTRRRDVAVLAVVLALTAAAAAGHFALPLDVRNTSMKARGTPAAVAARARDAAFGSTTSLLALLEPRGHAVSGAPDDPAVAEWLEQARALEGVHEVDVLDPSDACGTLAAIEVEEQAGPSVAAELRAEAPPTHRLALTGQPVGEAAVARELAREQARIVPLILGAFAVLLGAVYRRVSLVVAGLMAGVGAILWLGGLQYLLGLPINPISALLAPVVLTVGVAGSVHLLEGHLALLAAGVPGEEVPGRAIRALHRPLALATATTVAGFLALAPSAIPAVARFGWLAAAGVLLALGWTALIVPAWLRSTVARGAHARIARPEADRLARGRRVVRRLRAGAAWCLPPLLAATCWLAWRGSEVRVDTDFGRILPETHRFQRDTARVAERLGGIETFDLYVPPQAGPLDLAAAQRTIAAVSAEPLVRSLAGPPRRAPDGSALATVLLRPGGTTEREALFERVEAAAAASGLVGARVTGGAVQVAQDSGALVRDVRGGLLAILALLGLTMAAGLRSWRLGLLGLIPNAVPCAVVYGALELADRPLSVATAMIATVLLGLIVDDTIHLLLAYADARREGRGPGEAVARALARTGRPVVVTSAVLALGFGAGLAGQLETTREFAVLSASTIVLALGCNTLLLPAILVLPEALGRRRRRRALRGRGAACAETTTC